EGDGTWRECRLIASRAARPTHLAPAISRHLLDSRQLSSIEVPVARIELTVFLALSLFRAPLSVEAQQMYRQAHKRVLRLRDRSAVRGKGACRYCNRRIDLVPNHPAPTIRRHTVVRRLLLSRKRHPEDWAKPVDSQERVVCPGSGQP